MIKKNADEEWTDISTRSIHQELMTHTIKLLGSEERARAMLAAGTLRLPPGNSAERKKAGGSPVAPSRVRPGPPPLPSPRQRPWRPLQAALRDEYRSKDRTGKAAAAGSNEATLAS
jgi:hypothetical protein